MFLPIGHPAPGRTESDRITQARITPEHFSGTIGTTIPFAPKQRDCIIPEASRHTPRNLLRVPLKLCGFKKLLYISDDVGDEILTDDRACHYVGESRVQDPCDALYTRARMIRYLDDGFHHGRYQVSVTFHVDSSAKHISYDRVYAYQDGFDSRHVVNPPGNDFGSEEA
jgi:hypothetical protein